MIFSPPFFCVCSENDHSWCLDVRAVLDVTRRCCGEAILSRKNHQHTQALEGLSQRGCIWHIASKRHALTWPGNWFYLTFGRAESLLCVSPSVRVCNWTYLTPVLTVCHVCQIIDTFWLDLLYMQTLTVRLINLSPAEWISGWLGINKTMQQIKFAIFYRPNYEAVIHSCQIMNGVFGKWKETMHEGQVQTSFILSDWLHAVC